MTPASSGRSARPTTRSANVWDDYISAYEEALSRCSTQHAPWFIIPANHKWFRNLAIARIVVEHLEALKMQYPKPTVDLKCIRREYQRGKAEYRASRK